MTDDELLDRIIPVFQRNGYAGTSIAQISEATGLGKASLYHRFPEGKTGIAEEVMRKAEGWLTEHALRPLESDDPPAERLAEMGRRLSEFYDSGRRSCLLDVMSLGAGVSPVSARVHSAMSSWIKALQRTLVEHGVPADQARSRAEDIVIKIQGSLVVSRALGNQGPYQRTIATLGNMAPGGSP